MGSVNQIRLSAVVPCYREALSIPVMHERLTKVFTEMGVDWEIIFVDSGSPEGDPTPGVLAEIAAGDRRTTVIHHTRAFGSQSAYSSGMRIASGDAVILLDGDLQDPPEMIPEMFARWQEGYEVVYGERITREGPALMNAGRKAFYRVFQRTAYVPMPVDAGDFSLLDRKAVDAINELPENHRFVRGLRAFVGFRQIGIPYDRPERLFGVSSNNFLANMGWARRAIVSFSYAPLDLMIWLAAITTTIAILAAIVEIVLRIVDPGAAPKGYATLIIVILFIGGVQMICFGVVGSYLAHMYEEIKRRPAYIVSQVLNPPRPRQPVEGVAEELVHADVRVVATSED
jgi:glycosyltransferase involved in cell wall biosynthesis